MTDKSVEEIRELKLREPMGVKMELAQSIVRDFHGPEAALQAQLDFDREVRQGDVPEDIQEVVGPRDILLPYRDDAVCRRMVPLNTEPHYLVKLDTLLARAGLTESVATAKRLREQGAVLIYPAGEADRYPEPVRDIYLAMYPGVYVFRVGKQWKRVRVPE